MFGNRRFVLQATSCPDRVAQHGLTLLLLEMNFTSRTRRSFFKNQMMTVVDMAVMSAGSCRYEDTDAHDDVGAETNRTRNEADVKDGRLRCSLTVQASQPPRLKVLERGYTVLVLEASNLPVGCIAQVLKAGDDDIWTEASEKKLAKAETENTSYRLRLRTSISVEPLRFMFSELVEPEHDPAGTTEDAAEWLGAPTSQLCRAFCHTGLLLITHTASCIMASLLRLALRLSLRSAQCHAFRPPPSLEPALVGCGSHQHQRIVSVTELAFRRAFAAQRQGLAAAVVAAGEAMEAASRVFGIWILNRQSRMFRGVHGNLNPSLWRWYHRHGYWATRRKIIDFGTKRTYRYNQVEGFGKRSVRYMRRYASWWMRAALRTFLIYFALDHAAQCYLSHCEGASLASAAEKAENQGPRGPQIFRRRLANAQDSSLAGAGCPFGTPQQAVDRVPGTGQARGEHGEPLALRTTNKATSNFCPGCGKSWKKLCGGQQTTYSGEEWTGSWHQGKGGWGAPQTWSQPPSPRGRRPKSPRGKGKGKQQGKHEGKGKPDKGGVPPTARPNLDQLPKAPQAPAVALPALPKPGTGTSGSADDKKLHAFLDQLAKQDDLPQSVLDLMNKATGNSVQEETKALHKRASWASYSESLLQLLEQFKTRQETLEKLDKAQLEWTEQLRTVSGQIKKATSESSDTQDIESSGSEEMDEDVEDAETCAARQEQKRQQVAGQHAQILSALQKVQQSAREGASRREGSRTPRRKAEQSQSHGIHRQGSRRPGWQQAVFLLGSYACLSDVCEPFHPERSHSVQAELDFVDLLHAQFYACALTLTVAQPQLYPSLFDPRVPACDPAGSAEAHAGGPARLLSTFQVPPSMMATAGVEPDEVGGRCAPFSASPACCSNRPGILKHVQSHVQSGRLCRQVTFSSSPRIHLFHPSDRLPPAVPITEVCLLHAFFLALAGANAIERNGRDHTAQKGCPRQFYPKSRTSRHYQGRSCAGLARGAPSSTGLQRTCASVPMGNAAERAFYCIYGF
eukprot:s75_g12.t1